MSQENALDTLRPVSIVKKCVPPCENNKPCLRLCGPQTFLGPQYPYLNASNIKACYTDAISGELNCKTIDEAVAYTLFGNNTSNAGFIKI